MDLGVNIFQPLLKHLTHKSPLTEKLKHRHTIPCWFVSHVSHTTFILCIAVFILMMTEYEMNSKPSRHAFFFFKL